MLGETSWTCTTINIDLFVFIPVIINDDATKVLIMIHHLLVKCVGCFDTILILDMPEIPETNRVVENNTCVLTFANCSRCVDNTEHIVEEMGMSPSGNVKVSTELFTTLGMYQIASWAGFEYVVTSVPSFVDIYTIREMMKESTRCFRINTYGDGEGFKLEAISETKQEFFWHLPLNIPIVGSSRTSA